MKKKPDFSVIILLEEESTDFALYIKMLHDLFQRRNTTFEFIIIANGAEQFLRAQSDNLFNSYINLKAYSFPNRVSQSVCVRAALKESTSNILVMCGSYQQITADGFNLLLDTFSDKIDLICPWRYQRVDPSFNQFQSRIFNTIITVITGSQFHDLSCMIRVFKREILEKVPIYGNLYRFLPILAKLKGYHILEIPCAHYQERGKTGFYRISEYMERIIDIGTLFFNTRFSRKPLRFFSIIGSVLGAAGSLITLWIFIEKIFYHVSIGNRPTLLSGIILMVTGVQIAALGLLGEIIAFTHGRKIKEYTIDQII